MVHLSHARMQTKATLMPLLKDQPFYLNIIRYTYSALEPQYAIITQSKVFVSSDPSCSLTLFKLASNNYLSLTESKKSLHIVKVLHLMASDPNSTCSLMSLNFSSSSTSLIMRCAVFLLRAFATTFSFPRWYNSSKS